MSRASIPVSLPVEKVRELDELVRKRGYRSRSELMREAIEDKLNQLRGAEIIELRDIPRRRAKKEILRYIKGKERVYASDVADDLRLDLGLVFDIIRELFQEEKIEEAT